MKKIIYTLLPVLLLFFSSCSTGQEKSHSVLEAKAFRDKLDATTDPIVLDVRTKSEFAEGHIGTAINVDWNGSDFDEQMAFMDKKKPYFVYCLAGGRSADAVAHMQEMGFGNIYELEGGMLKWRQEQFPEVGEKSAGSGGMTEGEFKQLLNDDRTILVDFYAEWCGPCKKMKPILEEIEKEKANTVKVIRIDVDQNPDLAKAMKIDAFPTFLIIRDNAVTWNKIGFTEKQELLEHLQ